MPTSALATKHPSNYSKKQIISTLQHWNNGYIKTKNTLTSWSIKNFCKKKQEILCTYKKTLYLCIAFREKHSGALVQLVRIHACHAWGHEFESRTHRNIRPIYNVRRYNFTKLQRLIFFRPRLLQSSTTTITNLPSYYQQTVGL